jgi:hypothetical protein
LNAIRKSVPAAVLGAAMLFSAHSWLCMREASRLTGIVMQETDIAKDTVRAAAEAKVDITRVAADVRADIAHAADDVKTDARRLTITVTIEGADAASRAAAEKIVAHLGSLATTRPAEPRGPGGTPLR